MDYTHLASKELLAQVKQNLEGNGFVTHVVGNGAEAKDKVESLLTEGSSVMAMTSVTLETIGVAELVEASGKYDASKSKMYSDEGDLSAKDKKALGCASDFTLGSLNAITNKGELVVVSNTGSQIGAYVYGSDKVIFVVGTNKIVDGGLDAAFKRIYEYTLPLESERAKKAYGAPGSNVSKMLVINKEIVPERVHVVLVEEVLGY